MEKVGFDEDTARGLIRARRRLIDEDPAYVPPRVKRKLAAKEKVRERTKVKVFIGEYRKTWAATRRSSKTFFEPMLRQMEREFGDLALADLTTQRIQAFIAKRSRTTSPATANKSLLFIKNLLARAVEWGYLSVNAAGKIKLLQEPPHRETFLTPQESDALLAKAPAHVRPIIQLALLTGMRRGEILALAWDQVDLKDRRIHLRQTKNGRARVIPIGDDLLELLKAIARHTTTDRVFTYYGRPLKSLQGSWEATRDDAGLSQVRFHDLRHTWASRMAMAGVDLYTLMKLGGWADVSMVCRYAHFAPEYKLKVAQLLNGTAGSVATPRSPEARGLQVVGKVVGPSVPCGEIAEAV